MTKLNTKAVNYLSSLSSKRKLIYIGLGVSVVTLCIICIGPSSALAATSTAAVTVNSAVSETTFWSVVAKRRPMKAAKDYTWSLLDMGISTTLGNSIEQLAPLIGKNCDTVTSSTIAFFGAICNGYSSYCREGFNGEFPHLGGFLHGAQGYITKARSELKADPQLAFQASIHYYRYLLRL